MGGPSETGAEGGASLVNGGGGVEDGDRGRGILSAEMSNVAGGGLCIEGFSAAGECIE